MYRKKTRIHFVGIGGIGIPEAGGGCVDRVGRQLSQRRSKGIGPKVYGDPTRAVGFA